MSRVTAVIRREYLQRVRTKAFVLSTIGLPLFMAAVLVVPGILGARSALAERELAVVDRTGVLFPRVEGALRQAGFTLVEIPDEPGVEERLEAEVEGGKRSSYLILDGETLERGRVVFGGRERPNTIRRFGILQGVTRAALELRMEELGEDAEVAALLSGGELEVRLAGGRDDSALDQARGLATGFVGAFLLYMVLIVYGTTVLRAVIEEKTGRIVEIIISAMKPWELMLGKILGVGAVGLTQLAVWVTSAILLATLGIPALVAFLPEMDAELIRSLIPTLGLVLLMVLFFLLGYVLYSSLFAAVGAMCSSEEDAQQAQFPVMMLLIVPVILLMPMMDDPTAPWARVVSQIPFFAPILMFGRVGAGAAAGWEVALSLFLMAVAVPAVAWVAGRIYRVGILMQGKRPTLPELWRWVRAG